MAITEYTKQTNKSLKSCFVYEKKIIRSLRTEKEGRKGRKKNIYWDADTSARTSWIWLSTSLRQ